MPRTRLELVQPYGRRILSPRHLPFLEVGHANNRCGGCKEQALRQAAVKRLENLTQESIDFRDSLPKDFDYRYSIEQQRLAIAQSIFSRENLPSRAQRLSLLDMAKNALNFYKQYKNDEFEGNFYLTSAGLLIDLSIGKVAELPISLYQGITGKEFLTGRQLS